MGSASRVDKEIEITLSFVVASECILGDRLKEDVLAQVPACHANASEDQPSGDPQLTCRLMSANVVSRRQLNHTRGARPGVSL